jgi:hypothetical protein
MTTTPELDRALQAASDAIHGQGWSPRSHIYARGLIAELLRGMEKDPYEKDASGPKTYSCIGFNAALAEIKRRAGIVEGEG